jgi:hypothetical protein
MNLTCEYVCILATAVLFWTGNLFAQAPDTLWTKTYGGINDDISHSIQQTIEGGYIIAGYTNSFGAGGHDVYLLKTDASGDTLWTKTYGGVNNDISYSIQQTSDGGYIIAGYTNSFGAGGYDVYLLKTDASGDTLWTKTYGGVNNDISHSIQQTSDGGYVTAGYTYSFGAGMCDVYLIKTDSLGDTLWTKTYGDTLSDLGYSVDITSDAGYIITGSTNSSGYSDVWLIKTDSLGDTLWTETYGFESPWFHWAGNSVQQTTDGGYIVAGYISRTVGNTWVLVIKTDAGGDTMWIKTYSPGIYDYGYSVQQTSDGGYIIVGETWVPLTGDVYVIKIDSLGNTDWTKTFGGTDYDVGACVRQTIEGSYIITGYTNSFGAGGRDVYLIKIAPDTSGIEEHQTPRTKSQTPIIKVFPNPFSKQTRISFSKVQGAKSIELKIYDAAGRVVRSFPIINLCNPNKSVVSVYWDGTDDSNRKLPCGVYFLKFTAGDYEETRKLLLIK